MKRKLYESIISRWSWNGPIGIEAFCPCKPILEQVLEAQKVKKVDLALKERPDVIIMDIVMPELNGIDNSSAILKSGRS